MPEEIIIPKRSINITDKISRLLPIFKIRFWILKAVILGAISGIIIAFFIILISDFHKVKALGEFQPNITTKIYDKNEFLISELFRQKRELISLSKIPSDLINSFIAIEDREYYDHMGINIKGIVRAFFINIFSGKIRQGGSTITQQLAKILLTSRERSIYRKIKEAFIAIMMEFFYNKQKILELYLNQIFLGHGVYGVESASRFYFDKHVWELDLAESALLASLPSSPNKLSPIRHPKRSMERHKTVLAGMVEMGFISIIEAEEVFLRFWPLYLEHINELSPTQNTWSSRVDKAPWFTEYIRRRLIKKYGERRVYEKGLKVYTTLDIDKQIAGQRILSEALRKQTIVSNSLLFKNEDYIVENYSNKIELFSLLFNLNPFNKKGSIELKKLIEYAQKEITDELEIINYFVGFDEIGKILDIFKSAHYGDKELQKVEGCLISINHRNGYIEAMIGGSEFSSINQLNRVMQSRRQPGSAIKPLLYTAALESGRFTSSTAILDSPLVYLDNEGGDWIPENYEGEYYGLVRLRSALAKSINGVSIRVADQLGIDYVMEFLSKLLKIRSNNINKRIPRNLSIALGSFEISSFELARAYAIIANGGRDVIPFSIRYITDRNGVIIENQEEEVKKILLKKKGEGRFQIITPSTSQIMISMLKSVITSGTAHQATIGMPAGGKTGTTNNWRDAWFIGFSPQITTCLWMGYDTQGLSLGIGQSGGVVAAPVWAKYMKEILRNEPYKYFPFYATLIEKDVCAHSGKLPSPNCRNVIKEVFNKDTLPNDECTICKGIHQDIALHKKGPRVNIIKAQKKSIFKNINSGKVNNTIIDNIDNNLLD